MVRHKSLCNRGIFMHASGSLNVIADAPICVMSLQLECDWASEAPTVLYFYVTLIYLIEYQVELCRWQISRYSIQSSVVKPLDL